MLLNVLYKHVHQQELRHTEVSGVETEYKLEACVTGKEPGAVALSTSSLVLNAVLQSPAMVTSSHSATYLLNTTTGRLVPKLLSANVPPGY